jgi:hypothetical protein
MARSPGVGLRSETRAPRTRWRQQNPTLAKAQEEEIMQPRAGRCGAPAALEARSQYSRRLYARRQYARRRSLPSLLAAALLAAAAALGAVAPDAGAVVPATPTVLGPITGPEPMHPGMRPGPAGTNPEDFDYVVDEYFVAGTAGPSGATYKVRMLVRRPAKPEKSSGIVIFEPTHQGGNALIFQFARFGALERGHIGITVSSQAVVLTSTTVNPANPRGIGLYTFNPDRYGTFPNDPSNPLLHVNNNQSNEILAQIAWLIKSNHPSSPLNPDYPVTGLVMGGTSASSGFVRSYMANAHNSAFRTPDGGPIVDGFLLTATLGSAPVEMTDVPTIQLPTQFEVAGTNAYRRPDSDAAPNLFRIFEVPGMSHNDSRDQPPEVFPGCHEPLSRFPYGAMTFMALQWLIDWALEGDAPPNADYIEVDAGPPRAIVFDEFGNAKGGVRTPHLDVPVYRYVAPNTAVPGTLCNQTGRQELLAPEVLQRLYKNDGQYVSRFNRRLKELERDGWWPKEYSDRYARDDAKEFTH